jgi:hypothetical protein
MKQMMEAALAACRGGEDGAHVFIEVTIPSYELLTVDERAAVDGGEAWPVRVDTKSVSARECRFLEFLVERTFAGRGEAS